MWMTVTAQGWTEWTQGFQFGSSILQFDATDDGRFLELGRERTFSRMAPHLTHMGVHDHGFNNVSTWGTLRRLDAEGRYEAEARERDLCELALKVSGAVQARRWTSLAAGGGFIYPPAFHPHQPIFDQVVPAHTMGAAWDGVKTGRFGHAACFSTQTYKRMNSG